MTSFAQSLKPSISEFPDLSPSHLRQWKSLKTMCDSIWEGLLEKTPEREMLCDDYQAGGLEYMQTLGEGCSWYCATGPDSIYATSTLASNTDAYKPEHIHDFDLRTAWSEGIDNPIGVELVMRIPVKNPLRLTDITIYNGYCKSEAIWKANGRVKEMLLYANGRLLGTLELEDTYHGQTFELGSLAGDANGYVVLKFVVYDVYPGDQYDDVCISEINLDGTGDH